MLLGWGIFLVVVGSAFNELAVGRILYPNGLRLPATLLWTTRILDVLLIAWGTVTIVLRHKMIVKKVNLALFSLMFIGPLAAEVGLRISLLFPKSPTRNPELFGNYYFDDDYWRMQMMWKPPEWPTSSEYTHTLLGWSQDKVTEANPLGLVKTTLARLKDDGTHKILFYGDSYVAGETDADHRLPAYMEKRMGGVPVVDLGVGGYGSDQSYLLFRESWEKAGGKPTIIMGVLTEDLDRALLTIRTAPKPRLVPGAKGRLQPRHDPLPRDSRVWLEAHPLRLRSYFASLLLTAIRQRDYNPRVEEACELNRKIIEAVDEITKNAGLDLLYVIFYGPSAIEHREWRETFLKDELDERSIRYLDSRLPIYAWCKRTGRPVADLYHENGHHNNLGNSVIGDALVETITKK
jgi:hypothetical protein